MQITETNSQLSAKSGEVNSLNQQLTISTATFEAEQAQLTQLENEVNNLENQLQEAQQIEQQTLADASNKETDNVVDFFRGLFD